MDLVHDIGRVPSAVSAAMPGCGWEWNAATRGCRQCGDSPTPATLPAQSASVQAVGAGTIADLWAPFERGRAMGYFYLGKLPHFGDFASL